MSRLSSASPTLKFNQMDGSGSRCSLQFPVQGGERKSAITSELQIGSVVNRQLRVNGRREEPLPRFGCAWRLHLDRQRSQEFCKFKDVVKSDPLTTHGDYQPVHHLRRPVCRYDRLIPGAHTSEKCCGLGSCFILETPRECCRGVNHEYAQYFLPSLIKSLIGMPPRVLRSRNCRIRSTASAGVIRGFGATNRSSAKRSSPRSMSSAGEPASESWFSKASAWGVSVTVMLLNVTRLKTSTNSTEFRNFPGGLYL